MIPVRGFDGRRVMVYGLNRPGLAAARALKAGGAQVSGWDEAVSRRERAQAQGVTVEDPTLRDWGDLAALTLGDPGVMDMEERPRILDLAVSTGAPFMTGLDLFGAALDEAEGAVTAVIAGGSQAVAAASLTAWLLQDAGLDAHHGGPHAPPLDLPVPRRGSIYILACETRELERTTWRGADAALLLAGGQGDNDVLMELMIRGAGPALACVDDERMGRMFTRALRNAGGRREVEPVSGRQVLTRGVYALGGELFDVFDGAARRIACLEGTPALCGHSPAMIAGAAGLARRLGARAEDIERALLAWPGAPGLHEPAGQAGRVTFVNHAAAADIPDLLAALGGGAALYWITGGEAHAGVLEALESAGVRPAGVYLADGSARTVKKLKSLAPCSLSASLDEAVRRAVHDAAARRGEPVRIVYAPLNPQRDCDAAADRREAFSSCVERLMALAFEGEAA